MKKKFSVKTLVIMAVVLVVVVLGVIAVNSMKTFMTGATGAVEPKGVMATSGSDGKSATVTWTSDKESIAKIEYGTTAASLVLMTAETDSTTDHRLTLTSLRPSTTYYYRIRVGEEVFDNGGIPYNFKTKGEEITPTLTPTAVPSVAECVGGVDYNGDGIINSFDIMNCRKSMGTVQGATTSVCETPGDLNKDGIVNSFDIIKCLQAQKR